MSLNVLEKSLPNTYTPGEGTAMSAYLWKGLVGLHVKGTFPSFDKVREE